MKTELKTPHQVILERIEREIVWSQTILDRYDGVAPDAAQELASIGVVLDGVATRAAALCLRLDALSQDMRRA